VEEIEVGGNGKDHKLGFKLWLPKDSISERLPMSLQPLSFKSVF